MTFTSAFLITGPLHFVMQVAPLREPAVLLVIGAALVGLATMVRSRFSD